MRRYCRKYENKNSNFKTQYKAKIYYKLKLLKKHNLTVVLQKRSHENPLSVEILQLNLPEKKESPTISALHQSQGRYQQVENHNCKKKVQRQQWLGQQPRD